MAKARAGAIIDARDQAEQYAKAAGTRLGRALSISTTGSDTLPSPVIPGAPFAHRSAVPISAGTAADDHLGCRGVPDEGLTEGTRGGSGGTP